MEKDIMKKVTINEKLIKSLLFVKLLRQISEQLSFYHKNNVFFNEKCLNDFIYYNSVKKCFFYIQIQLIN